MTENHSRSQGSSIAVEVFMSSSGSVRNGSDDFIEKVKTFANFTPINNQNRYVVRKSSQMLEISTKVFFQGVIPYQMIKLYGNSQVVFSKLKKTKTFILFANFEIWLFVIVRKHKFVEISKKN